MDFANNMMMILSLSATAVFGLLGVVIGYFLLGKGQPKTERLVLTWMIYNALTHFLMEGSFVVLSLTETVNASSHFTSHLWKEYGKADSRWLVVDPTIVSLELLTVVVDGLLCLVVIAGIVTRGSYRHYAQVVLCVCELYGGWMTFCPEWLTGSPSLDTSNPMYLWVYLVFFNSLWVVIPLLLMYQSWLVITSAVQQQLERNKAGQSVGKARDRQIRSKRKDQ